MLVLTHLNNIDGVDERNRNDGGRTGHADLCQKSGGSGRRSGQGELFGLAGGEHDEVMKFLGSKQGLQGCVGTG